MSSLLPLLALVPLLQQGGQGPGLSWSEGPLEAVLLDAARREELALLFFRMDGSEHCDLMEDTLRASAGELAGLAMLRVDVSTPSGGELLARYPVSTLPTVLFLAPDGSLEDGVRGYFGHDAFGAEVSRIRRGEGTLGALRRAVARAPEDLDGLIALASKLRFLGRESEAEPLFARVRARDPAGRTLAGERVRLWDVMRAIRAAAPDPNVSTGYVLDPLRAFLATARHREVLYEGWQWVAEVEGMRGQRSLARRAIRATWPNVDEGLRAAWARQTAERFYGMRTELDEEERAFALELAETALQLAREERDPVPAPDVFAIFHLTHARCLALCGRSEEARVACEQVLALVPDSEEARELRAELAGR